MKSLDFTKDEFLPEIDVTIPIDGKVEEFKLVVLNGQDATTYENARADCIKFDREGNPVGFKNVADLAPMLVGFSLKRLDGGLVGKKTVNSLPYPILKKLFEAAQELNGLNEEVRYTEAMLKVFSVPGSPVDMEEVREWLTDQDQDDKDVKMVTLLFKETDSELGKNSLSGTTDGT